MLNSEGFFLFGDFQSLLVFFVLINLSAFVQQLFLQPADNAYIFEYILSLSIM